MKRILPFVIILAVLGAAYGGYRYLTNSGVSSSNSIYGSNSNKPTVPSDGGQPSAQVPQGANPQHARGGATARVTLEEFGDFECPPCGQLYPILKTLEREYGDRLRVVFREFPLTPPHQHALAAAQAAEAAGLQGRFFEMHDLLYENQKAWHDAFDTRPIFEGYAKQIGLDVEKFKTDQSGEVVSLRITADGSRGHALGVKGTPTVFLDGREVPYEEVTTIERLRAVIQKAMNGQ